MLASAARSELASRGPLPAEVSRDTLAELVLEAVAKSLADDFKVSAMVIEKRLRKEGLWHVELT